MPNATYQRRRLIAAIAVVSALSIVWLTTRSSGRASSAPTTTKAAQSVVAAAPSTTEAAVAIDRIDASESSWKLPEPLSRPVVLAVEGHLNVYGGLQQGNTTTGAIVEIDAHTGQARQSGSLARPVHDAAGALIGTRAFIFGGGVKTVYDSVQTVESDRATVAGRLPTPRADLVAVPDGDQILILGGYDGQAWSPDVLATTDGLTFRTVATLVTPVRYPAAGVINGKLYVIGGEKDDKTSSTDIQQVDLTTGQAAIIGRLSDGLAHAASAVIGGALYTIGGRSGTTLVDNVNRFDPSTATLARIGRLPHPVSDSGVATLGDVAYVVGGETDKGPIDRVVQVSVRPSTNTDLPPMPAGQHPFVGQLLIADRGNNRLILVDENKKILWQYPSPTAPAPPEGFYFPDDAFFTRNGTAIMTNQEEQHTILEISYPDGKVLWDYGHPNQAGPLPGYLNQPDDAFRMPDGSVTVADAKNCRVLRINPDKTIRTQIGTDGICHTHKPPKDIAYPNGDTPLTDGNVLVSEINGSHVEEMTWTGQVIWDLKLPLRYPSDPQQIGPDLYLIADYAQPGGVYEFTREGQIVFQYAPTSGEGMLDHPSLAELLPSGLIAVNDDYRQRVVMIDPKTSQIVWQYGQTDTAGTGPNQLNTPDGMDLLAPGNQLPQHPAAG
jgi:hypothetical protein